MARYRRVLLPLDGSALAEAALVDAVAVADAMRAELTLLEVLEPVTATMQVDGPPIAVDEQVSVRRARALAYLDAVRHRIAGRDVPIRVAVEVGRPADAILDYVRAHAMELLVMATHGRSGVRRWVLGSVADKILRASSVPVLLVRVPGESTA